MVAQYRACTQNSQGSPEPKGRPPVTGSKVKSKHFPPKKIQWVFVAF